MGLFTAGFVDSMLSDSVVDGMVAFVGAGVGVCGLVGGDFMEVRDLMRLKKPLMQNSRFLSPSGPASFTEERLSEIERIILYEIYYILRQLLQK